MSFFQKRGNDPENSSSVSKVCAPHYVTLLNVLTWESENWKKANSRRRQRSSSKRLSLSTVHLPNWFFHRSLLPKINSSLKDYRNINIWHDIQCRRSFDTEQRQNKSNPPSRQQWINDAYMWIYHLGTLENKEIYIHISIHLRFTHWLLCIKMEIYASTCLRQTVNTCRWESIGRVCITSERDDWSPFSDPNCWL